VSALTATFEADFSSFYDACTKAEVSLRSFETEAGNVTTSLNRMVDQFDGRKLIEQATLMAEAVDRIGADHLTEQELQRIGDTAQQAVEKMKALGIEVPPKLQALADSTHSVQASQVDLLGVLGQVAGAFGIAYSASALVAFVDKTIEQAQALQNLSLQTRINVEDLQRLQGVTADYGVSSEQLGNALFQLSRRIAGGDQSVATAYALMGLSLDEVKNKNPVDLFLTTEQALGRLHGQIQDTAAADLYGSRLGSSMVAFASGADTAKDKMDALTVATKENVKQTAEFGDAIDKAQKSLGSFATNMIGPLAEGFNNLNKLTDTGTSKWQIFWAMVKDDLGIGANGFDNLSTHTENLTRLFTQMQLQQERNIQAQKDHNAALGAAPPAFKSAEDAAASFMKAIDANAAKPILDWQVQYLNHLKDIGQLTAQNAEGIGVNSAQLEKYKADVEAAKKAETDRAEAAKKADAELMLSFQKQLEMMPQLEAAKAKAYGVQDQLDQLEQLAVAEEEAATATIAKLTSEQDKLRVSLDLKKALQTIDLQEVALNQQLTDQNAKTILATVDAQTRLNAAFGRDAQGNIKVTTDALGDYQKKLDDLNARIPATTTNQLQLNQRTAELALANQNLSQSFLDTARAQDAATAEMVKNGGMTQQNQTLVESYRASVQKLVEQYGQGSVELSKQLVPAMQQAVDTLTAQTAATNEGNIAWANSYAALKAVTAAANESTLARENSIAAWQGETDALNKYQGQLAMTTAEALKFNAAIALIPNTGQPSGASAVSGIGWQVGNPAATYGQAVAVLNNQQNIPGLESVTQGAWWTDTTASRIAASNVSATNPGGGNTVNVQSGAVTNNYPILNDPTALDQLATVVGQAVMAKLSRTG
jgi:hypothetical protein